MHCSSKWWKNGRVIDPDVCSEALLWSIVEVPSTSTGINWIATLWKKNRYANLTKRIKKEKSKSLHWYLGVILLKINWLEAVGKMAGVCIVIDFSDLIRFNSVAVLTSLCHSYLSILIQLLNKYENRLIGGRMINVKLLNFSCYLE